MKTERSMRWVRLLAVVGLLASLVAGRTYGQQGSSDAGRLEQQLALARKLLSEVERSPSANLEELRTKLRQARAETQAVLKESPQHPEAMKLLTRIDAMIAQLGPKARPDHPVEAEADATLDRLDGLVKGGGSRSEVEAVYTQLRKVIPRLKAEVGGVARLYEARGESLWREYAGGLGKVRDVCPDCPVLDLTHLAKGFSRPRLLGAGDYTLKDLEEMQKQGYKTLLTGDFNRDGTTDVALIGRGEQKGKRKLFLLIATVQKNTYRRLFLQPLDLDKAALTVRDGTLILGERFHAGDDFRFVIWNGKTFERRFTHEPRP